MCKMDWIVQRSYLPATIFWAIWIDFYVDITVVYLPVQILSGLTTGLHIIWNMDCFKSLELFFCSCPLNCAVFVSTGHHILGHIWIDVKLGKYFLFLSTWIVNCSYLPASKCILHNYVLEYIAEINVIHLFHRSVNEILSR